MQYQPKKYQPKLWDFSFDMGLGSVGERNDARQAEKVNQQEYEQALGGAFTQGITAGAAAGAYSGGKGPSAYGVTGTTGLPEQKGTAPYGLQPLMWQQLGALNTALKAAGLGTFKITDGWRSYAAQVDVKRRKPTLAAAPGHSVHGTGYASDLDMTSAQKQWLHANAGKYGLFFLAPPGKSEDWHIQLNPSLLSRSPAPRPTVGPLVQSNTPRTSTYRGILS